MMNEEAMQTWIDENFKANLDVIEDLSYAQIKQMVQDREYVLIYACKYRFQIDRLFWPKEPIQTKIGEYHHNS